MGDRRLVNATRDAQIEAFENAREVVLADADTGVVDAIRHEGEVTDGEVLRILSEAYTGDYETDYDATRR